MPARRADSFVYVAYTYSYTTPKVNIGWSLPCVTDFCTYHEVRIYCCGTVVRDVRSMNTFFGDELQQ